MEPPLTAQSRYLSAFSFPLCYATSDVGSDSDSSVCYDNQSPAARTGISGYRGSNISAENISLSQPSFSRDTPITPPPFDCVAIHGEQEGDYGNLVLNRCTRTFRNMEPTGSCAKMPSQGASCSAPPALMTGPSRGTSVASSFSSESLPVVTTSQGSTEHESSSYTVSGTTDGDSQSCTEKILEGDLPASAEAPCPSLCSSDVCYSQNAKGTAATSKYDVGEGNLMSHPELALSLESVLTVVPQPMREHSAARDARNTERKAFIKEQFLKKPSTDANSQRPKYSTSSCGDASLQSWDSHLEVDAAIEDIVESVIHELSICETELRSCSGTLSREESVIGDAPRRASPASLSSYTSSKRLEWDNGADIGYSGASERVHDHESLKYTSMKKHVHKSSSTLLFKETSALTEEKTVFAVPLFRDVVVQTETCPIKDAEVQANASTTNLASTQTAVTTLTKKCESLSSSSGAADMSSLASTKRGCSLPASPSKAGYLQGYRKQAAPLAAHRTLDDLSAKLDTAIRLPVSRGSFETLMPDYASNVSLCYSHRTFKEPSSSKKECASSVHRREPRYFGQEQKRCKDFTVPASDTSDVESEPVGIAGFTVINNNRLKMRLPTAVPGLASRSTTPAELPQAVSEVDKRRLDYWLTSGFPYVPAVVPLEADGLPSIHTAPPVLKERRNQCDPRLVVSGSSLPSISRNQDAAVASSQLASTALADNKMTRKRYVRPMSLLASKNFSHGDALLSMQTAASPKKLIRRDKLRIRTSPKSSSTKMHGRAMPSINVGAKATVLPQGNAEDASLSRSGESEVSSSPDLLAVPKARQAFAQQNSVTSYDTASEGTSSRLLAVNGRSCKLKRMAHRELEKLRFLVDRQRHGYLKQLQKEVERLHRLEQLFLLADGSRTASSPETQTTEKSSAEVAHGNTESNSAAVQTSESLLVACQQEDAGAKERCFVSVCNAGAKKQRDHLSPRRRKPISRRPVAWVVPFGSDSRYPGNRNNAASPKTSAQQHADKEESLQAAFAARCGHLIERLEARQSQVAILAEQRRKQQPTAGQAQLQGRTQEQRRPRGLRGGGLMKKTFTHREMREQTERVYQKLPEVVDTKTRLRREQQYRTNRLMAQLYNKALQEKALRGCVNFAINKPLTRF